MKLAHVLFTDLVGYSKLPVDRQTSLLGMLQECVRETGEFTRACAEGRLISLPTGDGMALVFFDDPEAPVRCSLEIGAGLRRHPEIKLRMGVHSGPVDEVVDINGNLNVTGAGINVAQRVMDCGDPGHILVSERVADDLGQFSHWQPYLRDLGEVAVKHGVRVHIYNLCTGEVGNPSVPKKFATAGPRGRGRLGVLVGAVALVAALLVWGQTRGFGPAAKPDATGPQGGAPPGVIGGRAAGVAERALTYWLTVQKMRDGRPYQEPFESSGQEIFEDGWQFWLNVSTRQSGYLYLLGEVMREGGDAAGYRVLYPLDAGTALVAAQGRFTFPPRNEVGYFLDDKHGTERLWLVWSTQPVTALESVKRFANRADQGIIADRDNVDEVRAFIAKWRELAPDAVKDPAGVRVTVNPVSDPVVTLLEIKHH